MWTAVVTLLSLLCVASLFVGNVPIAPREVMAVLTGDFSGAEEETISSVVLGLRVPRTLLGLLVGAALGLAGMLAQLHTRNPLADPGLLGVTSGASFGVVFSMIFLGFTSAHLYVWGALAGALIAGSLVLLLSSRVRSVDPVISLVLTGALVSALLGAGTTALTLTHPDISRSFQGWATGTLAGRPLELMGVVLPFLVAGLVLSVLNSASWKSLELGEHLARGLGRRVARDRMIGVGAIVLLSAAAAAVAGSIAFIGLLVPHMTRALVPGQTIASFALAPFVGATVLVAADVCTRLVASHGELPVGITMALLGAPVFVFLARKVMR